MSVIVLTPDELKQIISDAVVIGVNQCLSQKNKLSCEIDDYEPYFTIPEAARTLKCSTRNIYSLLNAGKLKKFVLSGKTLLLKTEVINAPKAA